MSDIHQEWRELRQKNGDFICHLDGEMDKLEKEKKQMIFYNPITCTYFKADRDEIQELINKLKEELISKTDSAKKMDDAYAQLLKENADLQKKLDAVEKEAEDLGAMFDKYYEEAHKYYKEVHKANVAKDRMGYSNRCMQSKIAKQANEIKRLTEENEKLRENNAKMSNMIDKLNDDASKEQILYHDLWLEKNSLKKALDQAAKDAEANFNRGRIKGMEEIWYELKDAYDGRPIGENEKIFGCGTVGEILMNLSPTWFINRAEEYHEQEDKQAKDIQIGDEVEIFDQFCPNDNPHSDIGIVIAIDKDHPCFAVIGPNFEGCFDETDIQMGNARKTGRHFDSISLDYFA